MSLVSNLDSCDIQVDRFLCQFIWFRNRFSKIGLYLPFIETRVMISICLWYRYIWPWCRVGTNCHINMIKTKKKNRVHPNLSVKISNNFKHAIYYISAKHGKNLSGLKDAYLSDDESFALTLLLKTPPSNNNCTWWICRWFFWEIAP